MRAVLVVVASLLAHFSHGDVDVEKTIVFGPGIENVDFDPPVRYFHVQLVDGTGKNLTKPPSTDFLRVEYHRQEGSENRCNLAIELLDLHDGSYVIRFRIYGNCEKIQIKLTTNETQPRHIAKSPYILEGPLNDDNCYCPKDFESFAKNFTCGSVNEQIAADLKRWPLNSLDFSQILDEALDRWASMSRTYSFCHYTIFKNELYRTCHGEYVGFKMFSDAILLSLLRKVKLQDTEFLFNLGDWPLETTGKIPVVSWCGSEATQDIVVPTYDMTEATVEMMGRQSLDILSMLSADAPKWEEKVDKAIWRGRDSSQERLLLVKMSRENNNTIEAAITRFFFFRDLIDTYGPETESLPFHEFFKYKYIINMDGTVAAYRFPYLLAGDSLVFKQESEYYEFFYKSLKPMVHYVPIKSDLSDLLEKIEWAKANPKKVKEIIKNARRFVMGNLLPANIFCYYAQMLTEYTKRLKIPPQRIPVGAELVKQPDWDCACGTQRQFDQKEEL